MTVPNVHGGGPVRHGGNSRPPERDTPSPLGWPMLAAENLRRPGVRIAETADMPQAVLEGDLRWYRPEDSHGGGERQDRGQAQEPM